MAYAIEALENLQDVLEDALEQIEDALDLDLDEGDDGGFDRARAAGSPRCTGRACTPSPEAALWRAASRTGTGRAGYTSPLTVFSV